MCGSLLSAARAPRMLAIALACGAMPASSTAVAQEPTAAMVDIPPQPQKVDLSPFIDQLVANGKADEAVALLEDIIRHQPANQQARFLLGNVHAARGDYHRAIRIYRAMLIDHPEATRVRLELARAHFLAHDYHNSDRQFRAARAGDIPPDVAIAIDSFLLAIREAKT